MLSGCAATARDIGAAATPAVVHSGLHEANTADSRQQIQSLADSPAAGHIGQTIGVGVGVGLFDEANKFADQLQAAGATPAGQLANAGASSSGGGATSQSATQSTSQPATQPAAKPPGGLIGLLSGGSGGFINSTIQEAFAAADNPKFREGEMKLSEAIGEGFVTGMITVINKQGPAIGDTVRTQIGPITQMIIKEQLAPAIADTIRNQIAPVVADTLQHTLAPAALDVWKQGMVETLKLTVRPDIQPDVIQNAHNASLGASRGTHEAMVEAGLVSPSGGMSPEVKVYLWVITVGAGCISLALFTLLVILNVLAISIWRRRRSGAVA